MLRERERVATPVVVPDTHATEWVAGLIGMLAAIVGTWMYYGPSDGALTLFNWSWDVSALAEAWPFSLLIGAGALLAFAFGLFAYKAYRRASAVTTPVLISGILGLAALGGAITYLLIWIL